MGVKIGSQTLKFSAPPAILSTASEVGPFEGKGPLTSTFDVVHEDDLLGQKTWEMAESLLMEETLKLAMQKGGVTEGQVDFILAGDLINQLIVTNLALRNITIPFFGLYGACSTFTEAAILGCVLIDGGFAERVLGSASSHHSTAERQYRFPTEYGAQRSPTAQWTVTGAGAMLLGRQTPGLPCITHATVGKVVDLGCKDPNDMGGAMAPAAVDTLKKHFEDTGRTPEYYDWILTGDLGTHGTAIVEEQMAAGGHMLGSRYTDCGILIYDHKKQDTHAGGSGCGCSAVVFGGHVYSRMRSGELHKVLLAGTGALSNSTTFQQGQTMPAVCHCISIEG